MTNVCWRKADGTHPCSSPVSSPVELEDRTRSVAGRRASLARRDIPAFIITQCRANSPHAQTTASPPRRSGKSRKEQELKDVAVSSLCELLGQGSNLIVIDNVRAGGYR